MDDATAADALRQLLRTGGPVQAPDHRTTKKRKSKSKELVSVGTTDYFNVDSAEQKLASSAEGGFNRRVYRQPQEVEGIFDSEGELHLLDGRTNIVYSTARDKDGDLVPVGVYNREQQKIEFKEVDEGEAECLKPRITVSRALNKLCLDKWMHTGHMGYDPNQASNAYYKTIAGEQKSQTRHSYGYVGEAQYSEHPNVFWQDVINLVPGLLFTGAVAENIRSPFTLEAQAAAPQPAPKCREQLPALAFSSDPDDHCETSLEAYEHIKPLLLRLCKDLKKDACDLRLYDPYYCTGKTKKLLSQLGFKQVYNENEDFYLKVKEGALPPFDCIITNPPFSDSHIEQLLQHCCKCGKPWLILMPTYVALKEYYKNLVLTAGSSKRSAAEARPAHAPFYGVPKKRYNYWTPKNVQGRNLKARADGRTSPFVTMWFGQLHHLNDSVLKGSRPRPGKKKNKGFQLYKNIDEIPEGVVCV